LDKPVQRRRCKPGDIPSPGVLSDRVVKERTLVGGIDRGRDPALQRDDIRQPIVRIRLRPTRIGHDRQPSTSKICHERAHTGTIREICELLRDIWTKA
jgi:hypothetical protein